MHNRILFNHFQDPLVSDLLMCFFTKYESTSLTPYLTELLRAKRDILALDNAEVAGIQEVARCHRAVVEDLDEATVLDLECVLL